MPALQQHSINIKNITVVSPQFLAINTEQIFPEYFKLQCHFIYLCFQVLTLHVYTMHFSSTSDPSIMSPQVDALLHCNTMNIFSFELTDQSRLKAATYMFLDVDLRSRELLVLSCVAIFVLMRKTVDTKYHTPFRGHC